MIFIAVAASIFALAAFLVMLTILHRLSTIAASNELDLAKLSAIDEKISNLSQLAANHLLVTEQLVEQAEAAMAALPQSKLDILGKLRSVEEKLGISSKGADLLMNRLRPRSEEKLSIVNRINAIEAKIANTAEVKEQVAEPTDAETTMPQTEEKPATAEFPRDSEDTATVKPLPKRQEIEQPADDTASKTRPIGIDFQISRHF